MYIIEMAKANKCLALVMYIFKSTIIIFIKTDEPMGYNRQKEK